MPNVTMNALPTRNPTTITELTTPTARPTPSTAGTTNHPWVGWSRNITAATIVHSPTVDPSDRSNEPTRITTSAPSASSATELDCTKTLVRFERVRKYGLRNANTAQMQNSTTSGPAAMTRNATDRAAPRPRPAPPRPGPATAGGCGVGV